MDIFPTQVGGFNLGNQVIPNAPGLAGTHFSHWGVGGLVEVPSISFRDQIPVKFEMNTDGYSSGRRKVGMIVYVISENKFFQLLPKLNGAYVTSSQWNSFNNAQKIVVLDPTATAQDDDFVDYVGSGNPDDCWTELCLSCGNLEIIDKTTDYTFMPEDANKIFHFHTESLNDLNVYIHSSCPIGFNLAVNNVGTGMLILNGVKGVSSVLDAQNSGAFIYVKGPADIYAVGRL